MFGKLSVAFLLIATPALAQEAPPPAGQPEGATAEGSKPVAYKIKKICRSVEVVGSSIPRTSCTTKKVPIKPADEDADAGNTTNPEQKSQL